MKNMKETNHISLNDNGFTLIEILIAMAISGIVTAATYSTFKSHQGSYIAQDQVTEMQQNLRAAMSMISRDMRMAGYGVEAGEAFEIGGIDYDYDGEDDFQTNNDPNRSNVDGVMIRRSDSPPMDIIRYQGAASNLSVCSPSDFQVGDILTIITESGSNKYYRTIQVTQIQQTNANPCPSCCTSGKCDKINFSPGLSPYNNPGGLGDGNWENGTVAQFRDIAYFVDSNGPTLMRSVNGSAAQPVADNIEDLQFAYQDEDGNWFNTPPSVQDIRSVRINVLASTDRGDSQLIGRRPQIEDHATGGPDNRRRRLLATTVRVRNLGL